MKKNLLLILCSLVSVFAVSQKTAAPVIPDLIPAGVEAVVTKGSVTVDGKKIDYTAHAGYLNLKNDTGKLIAKVFFTYYKKKAKKPVNAR